MKRQLQVNQTCICVCVCVCKTNGNDGVYKFVSKLFKCHYFYSLLSSVCSFSLFFFVSFLILDTQRSDEHSFWFCLSFSCLTKWVSFFCFVQAVCFFFSRQVARCCAFFFENLNVAASSSVNPVAQHWTRVIKRGKVTREERKS